jgi:hypothetical protein
MSRTSNNYYEDDRLIAGFDYKVQAWVMNGVYMDCGHPRKGETYRTWGEPEAPKETLRVADHDCDCYGRLHAGEPTLMGQDHKDGHIAWQTASVA